MGYSSIISNAVEKSCKDSWHLVLYENIVDDCEVELKNLVDYINTANEFNNISQKIIFRQNCACLKFAQPFLRDQNRNYRSGITLFTSFTVFKLEGGKQTNKFVSEKLIISVFAKKKSLTYCRK